MMAASIVDNNRTGRNTIHRTAHSRYNPLILHLSHNFPTSPSWLRTGHTNAEPAC